MNGHRLSDKRDDRAVLVHLIVSLVALVGMLIIGFQMHWIG